MPKEKDTPAAEAVAAHPVESIAASREHNEGPPRFIRGDQVVDAEGKVVEGLSVKDGEITGTEKAAKAEAENK